MTWYSVRSHEITLLWSIVILCTIFEAQWHFYPFNTKQNMWLHLQYSIALTGTLVFIIRRTPNAHISWDTTIIITISGRGGWVAVDTTVIFCKTKAGINENYSHITLIQNIKVSVYVITMDHSQYLLAFTSIILLFFVKCNGVFPPTCILQESMIYRNARLGGCSEL